MLSFPIREAAAKAARVEGALGPDDPVWEEGDPRPAAPIEVSGRLSPAGAERFYLNAKLRAPVALECRRCLNEAEGNVDEEVQAVFAPEDDTDVSDPDVFTYDPGAREIDIRPAIRELWLLAVPQYALCRQECKGLCPNCGRDLNTDSCECEPRRDSRWDALRKATT